MCNQRVPMLSHSYSEDRILPCASHESVLDVEACKPFGLHSYLFGEKNRSSDFITVPGKRVRKALTPFTLCECAPLKQSDLEDQAKVEA